MKTLFGTDRDSPIPAAGGLIKHNPHLARSSLDYASGGKQRPAADPIGRGGLPDDRLDLDALLLSLCHRIASAGGEDLPGKLLCEELGLPDTRSLRLLVAYGHVHHRIRQIVGTPGSGYCWGDCRPESYEDMAAASRRMGICFLFNASLYSRKPAAIEVAQLVLDFAERTGNLAPDGKQGDEVTAWLQAENISHGDLVDAVVDIFSTTDSGREALRRAGRKHQGIFMDNSTIADLERQLEASLQAIHSARSPRSRYNPAAQKSRNSRANTLSNDS